MEPSHNPFSILSHLGSDQTTNSTLPLIDQLNTTQTASATVIKPSSVLPSKQSAFAHYHASSSASKRPKKYSTSHYPKFATKSALAKSSYLVHTVFKKRIGTELKKMRRMLMQAICKLNSIDDDVFNLEHKVELLEQHSENQLDLLKKLNLDVEVVGKGDSLQGCESVNGKCMVGSGEAMMEGEIAE